MSLVGLVFKISVLFWLALVMFPMMPYPFSNGVDSSWYYGVNIAHAKHLIFGKDIVFTMGPLSYLTAPVPGYAEQGAVLVFLLATYFIALYGLSRCIRAVGLDGTLAIGIVTAVLVLYSQHYPDKWEGSCLPLFLLIAARSRKSIIDFGIVGVLSGVTLLIKFSDGLLLCGLYFCLVAFTYFEQKVEGRARLLYPALLLVPLVTLQVGVQALQPGFWSSAAYLRNSYAVAAGYSEAMSVAGPHWQLALAILTIVFIFGRLALATDWSRKLIQGAVMAALIAFLSFKHGMVRQDGHADITQAKLAMAALMIMAVCSGIHDQRTYGLFAVTCALLAAAITAENHDWLGDIAQARWTLSRLSNDVDSMIHFDRAWEFRRTYLQSELASLRLSPQFQDAMRGNQSIDVFPNDIELLVANGWAGNFNPGPIFQSYSAYTPRLDGLNAAHLAGAQAPDLVLVKFGSIDGRHPFVEDPASWRTLIDRYDIRTGDPATLLLGRKNAPRWMKPELIAESVVTLGADLAIPESAPHEVVVVRADIQHSMWGDLRTFLFRGSPLSLQVKYKSGEKLVVRAMRPNLIEGAIIDPFPKDLSDLNAFIHDDDSRARVASIAFDGSRVELRDSIRLSWYRLRLAASPAAQ